MKNSTDPFYTLINSVRLLLRTENTTRLAYQNFYEVKFHEYVTGLKLKRAQGWLHAMGRHTRNREHLQPPVNPTVNTLALTKIEHAYRQRCEDLEIYKAFYEKQEQRFLEELEPPAELSPAEREAYTKERLRSFRKELDPHHRLRPNAENSRLP